MIDWLRGKPSINPSHLTFVDPSTLCRWYCELKAEIAAGKIGGREMKYWCDDCKEEFKRDDLTLVSTYPHTYLCAACEDEERLDSTCVTTREKEQLEAEIAALKDKLEAERNTNRLLRHDYDRAVSKRHETRQAIIEILTESSDNRGW